MLQTEATVFVVDDDVSVRESLAALVRFAGWPVLTFSSAQAFLDQARRPAPGCLVLDVSLPGLNGLELQERLCLEKSDLPIIFITGYADVPMSVRAMRAGAVTFLAKPVALADLSAAAREAIAKDAALRESGKRRATIDQRLNALTPREREVLMHVVNGKMNKQIAASLGAAEKTVKVHRGRLMRKMHVRSVAELVLITAQLPPSVTQEQPRSETKVQ